jgi:hypothetical protein
MLTRNGISSRADNSNMGHFLNRVTHSVGCIVLAASLAAASACGGSSDSAEKTIKVSGDPGSLVEADGSVWVLDTESGVVTRLDEVTHEKLAAIDTGIKYGFALHVVGDSIVVASIYYSAVIDPQTNTITTTLGDGNTGLPDSSRFVAITADSAFAIADSGDFVEFDPLTGREKAIIDRPLASYGSPMALVQSPLLVAGDSIFLFGFLEGAQWLTRFDVTTHQFTTLAVTDFYVAAAVAGSTIWLLDRGRHLHGYDTSTGDPVVGGLFRLPDTNSKLAGLDDDPHSLVVAADGTLWAIDQPAQILYQLDPATATVISATHLKFRPDGLLVTETSVWVSNPFDERVTVVNRSDLKPSAQS